MNHEEATREAEAMSEDQMMKRFLDFGYKSGPITAGTKSVYNKKMVKYLMGTSTPSNSQQARNGSVDGDHTPLASRGPSTPGQLYSCLMIRSLIYFVYSVQSEVQQKVASHAVAQERVHNDVG